MPARPFGRWNVSGSVARGTLFARWPTDRRRQRQRRASVGCRHGATRAGTVGRRQGSILSVAFSPTDNRLLAVGYGGQADVSHVALWDIDAGTELARLPGATDLPDFPGSEITAVRSVRWRFRPMGNIWSPDSASRTCLSASQFSQSAEGLGGRHAPTDPPPGWTHGLLCFSRLLEGRDAAGQRQPRRDGDPLVDRDLESDADAPESREGHGILPR